MPRICCFNNESGTSRWLLNYSGVIDSYVLHCHLLQRSNGPNGGHFVGTVEVGKSPSQLKITLRFGAPSCLISRSAVDSPKRNRCSLSPIACKLKYLQELICIITVLQFIMSLIIYDIHSAVRCGMSGLNININSGAFTDRAVRVEIAICTGGTFNRVATNIYQLADDPTINPTCVDSSSVNSPSRRSRTPSRSVVLLGLALVRASIFVSSCQSHYASLASLGR